MKTLICIPDPANVDKAKVPISSKMELYKIVARELMYIQGVLTVMPTVGAKRGAIEAAKAELMARFSDEIQIHLIAEILLSGINRKDILIRKRPTTLFHIGKGENEIFCGPLTQVIPSGRLVRLEFGYSIFNSITKEDYAFDSDNQIMVKVGSESDDYFVIIGSSGCILVKPGGVVHIDLPLHIIEKTGRYYHVSQGRRIITLVPGGHFMIYTKTVPLLFVTVEKTQLLHEPTIRSESTEDLTSIDNLLPLLREPPYSEGDPRHSNLSCRFPKCDQFIHKFNTRNEAKRHEELEHKTLSKNEK